LQNQPVADQQLQQMASELWGDVDGKTIKSRKVGKGMILNGLDMKEAFALIGCIPDCVLPEDRSIHYGHRSIKDGEIYFVTNQTAETKLVTPEFRVKGKQPELWEATTGNIRNLKAFDLKENTCAVPLKLAPYESVFVVFREPAGKSAGTAVEANYPEPKELADLKGPWTVTFNAAQRGPAEPVIFDKLTDWTTSNDDLIKYYSGTAFYTSQFKIDKLISDANVILDLGLFSAMAKVTINGKYAGGVWTAPYQLDINQFVKEGDNEIKIELVNTWVNRLIGDSKLPEKERLTWCPANPYKSDSKLQPSGLIGPVKILSVKYGN
jgi:hypothetical protein